MSDYISKSKLIEVLENECKGQLIGNENVTLISFGDVIDLVFEQPTLDEREIIRKPFERVVERLEKYKRANDMCRENAASAKRHENVRYFENLIFATEQAISMVKEEGGIE